LIHALTPETQDEIDGALHARGRLSPLYTAFIIKWMAFNRAYNELENTASGDWAKVASFAERHQDRWPELVPLATELVSLECIGSENVPDSCLVAPHKKVKAATIYLREKLGLAANVLPNHCTFAGCTRDEKRRICNAVDFNPWQKGELVALLCLVYQVRCNLMHGEKRLVNNSDCFQTDRDKQLVLLSRQILDQVLHWLIL